MYIYIYWVVKAAKLRALSILSFTLNAKRNIFKLLLYKESVSGLTL